jgi:hypothetical protein
LASMKSEFRIQPRLEPQISVLSEYMPQFNLTVKRSANSAPGM